jgi:hypothetical protein
MVAGYLEESSQEGCGTPHLVLGIQTLQVEDCGNPMNADALARDFQASLGMVFRVYYEVPELVCERDEIAFGIDDRLLDPRDALFQQSPKQMRFARTGIALDQ